MKTKVFGYAGGTFSQTELKIARDKGIPLTLDFAIPCRCLNECIFCGYKNTQKGKKLSLSEIKNVIDEFSNLGGKSIKILGEGEPLLRNDILEIYFHIYGSGLQPVLFTCGDVMGDDNLARKIHKISGGELASQLNVYKTTVILKYDAKDQDEISQRPGYSRKRDLALKKLMTYGFNQYHPTHLGFGVVVLSLNYNEIPVIYEFAVKNNIYPLLCPLMPIGKAGDPEYRKEIGITQKQMVDLSISLYKIALENGIKIECPADFPGGLPCDISRAGFYIGDTGDIYLCEAEDKIGNVRDLSLRDAWEKIKEIKDEKYGKDRWTGYCFEKRKLDILPKNFEELVSKKLKKSQ